MECAALFIWLAVCLFMGGLVHSVMAGALSHRPIQILAAPGVIIRKFSMTLAALAFGGTVTRVCILELDNRDIDFRAEGAASVAKVMAPLAPLFGCAVAMVSLNAAFGYPLALDYSPPSLASLDRSGFQGFVEGTWLLLSGVIRQILASDWGDGRLYVLSALVFSLALGACSPMDRVKEAVLGAGVLTVTLAIFSSIAVRRAGILAATPAWFTATKHFIVGSSGVAFIMTVYGMMVALAVGFAVRIYEVITHSAGRAKPKAVPAAPVQEQRRKRAA